MTLDSLKQELLRRRELQFPVKITTKASRNELVSIQDDGVLRIKVTAAPEKGKANHAVRELLADLFGVSQSRVEILSGETSTHKRVRLSL